MVWGEMGGILGEGENVILLLSLRLENSFIACSELVDSMNCFALAARLCFDIVSARDKATLIIVPFC